MFVDKSNAILYYVDDPVTQFSARNDWGILQVRKLRIMLLAVENISVQ